MTIGAVHSTLGDRSESKVQSAMVDPEKILIFLGPPASLFADDDTLATYTSFGCVERILGRDALHLRRQHGVGQDLSVGVDSLDGVAEGQLLLGLGHVEETPCISKERDMIKRTKLNVEG